MIDIHSHVYLPRYVEILRDRSDVPRIVGEQEFRLLVLPGEDRDADTASGRPIGGEYFSPARKLAYMDAHGIDISVLSLANPWLEFVTPDAAPALATTLNEDLEGWCAEANGRFYGLGVLPITAPDACVAEIRRLAALPHMRGFIIGAAGRGDGLDDPRLFPTWEAAADLGLAAFVHPINVIGGEYLAGTGHTLALALGFPFETTIGIARLVLAGVLERFPNLKLIAAHSGGALPYLAGRIDGAAMTDETRFPITAPPSEYLSRIACDAISYAPATLSCAAALVGWDSLMFGTDHPFFRPNLPDDKLDAGPWSSPIRQRDVIDGFGPDVSSKLYHRNASRMLRLPDSVDAVPGRVA